MTPKSTSTASSGIPKNSGPTVSSSTTPKPVVSTCDAKLAGDFLMSCEHRPKSGIIKKWYGNWQDVDRNATTFKAGSLRTHITKLVLKAGTKLYKVEFNTAKEVSSGGNDAFVSGDYTNGFTHMDNHTIMYQGLKEMVAHQQLATGARIFSIIEKLDQGLKDEIAFIVLGLESGLMYNEGSWSTTENDSNRLFTLSTKEGMEMTPPKIFQDTDYATTLKFIKDNEF